MQEFNTGEEQLRIKMFNTRKYLILMAITFLLVDTIIFIPAFPYKPLFPNQVGIAINISLSIPLYIGLIYSYCRKSITPIRPLMVMCLLRIQMELWNLPGEEVGVNH